MPRNNTLLDVHNLLMEMAERLMDAETPEEIDKETKVAKSLTDVTKVIVDNSRNLLDAQKVALEYGVVECTPNEIFAIDHKEG